MRGAGRGIQFLRDNVDYDGPDCLIWPFSRNYNGHGQLGHNNDHLRAHRVMCELVNGPPPSPDHESAHSCGRGHEGCVHPKHLSWKTREGNQADRALHRRKIKNFRYKLTESDIAKIRTLEGKKTNTEIARIYGVSRGCIRQIFKGETWQHGYDPHGVRRKSAEQTS